MTPLTFAPSPHADDLLVIWRGGRKFACTKYQANAVLIVRNLNAHAALVEALKLAELWLVNCVPISEPTAEKPLPVIRRALALAEEPKP